MASYLTKEVARMAGKGKKKAAKAAKPKAPQKPKR